MLRPNKKCIIEQSSGDTDVYGQPVPGVRSEERCSVVRLNVVDQKSSVRADSSASRGNAREFQVDALLLLASNTKARIHDIIIVNGQALKIVGLQPRFNVAGKLDHYEATATIWTQ